MLVATVGIDEVGRGCWAGPLVAAAVLLKAPISGLTDSKLLNRKQRENLSVIIQKNAFVGIGWITANEVDAIGLSSSVAKAMRIALGQIKTGYTDVIIDGHINYLPSAPKVTAFVKADLFVPAVSAASIIAKVARDQYMRQMAQEYPGYGFEKHVGYGTRFHHEMLRLKGICDLHRRSFKPIRELL